MYLEGFLARDSISYIEHSNIINVLATYLPNVHTFVIASFIV